MRISLQQVQASRLPQAIGLCSSDLPGIAAYVNQAIQQLLYAGGDVGWWGCWAKVVFNASRENPYITLPRQFARAIQLAVCRAPIAVNGEFLEMMEDGIGLQPGTPCTPWCGSLAGYDRATVPTMVDLPPGNWILRAYPSDPADIGKRLLINCKDQNGMTVYSQDGNVQATGFFMDLDVPYVDSAFLVQGPISSVQKDLTSGDVVLKAVNPTTGVEITLSRYAPDEIAPSYRRYQITRLPPNCCSTLTPGIVQITALLKYEYAPVVRPTDLLIIGNLPAILEECKSLRYADMDVLNGAQLEAKCHAKAIRLLNAELRHETGELSPSVNQAPFGRATLNLAGIGPMV